MGDAFFRFYGPVGFIAQGFVKMLGPDLGVETDFRSSQFLYGCLGAFYQKAASPPATDGPGYGNPSQDPYPRFRSGEKTADAHGISLIIP